jgi:hypothetical protein
MAFEVDFDWEFDAPQWVDLDNEGDPDADSWFHHRARRHAIESIRTLKTLCSMMVRPSRENSPCKEIRLKRSAENTGSSQASAARSPVKSPARHETRGKRGVNPSLDFFLRFQAVTRLR